MLNLYLKSETMLYSQEFELVSALQRCTMNVLQAVCPSA